MGGGGLSASTSVASKSGDASSGINATFSYNGAMNTGGGSQEASAAATTGAGSNNVLLYVGIAAALLVGVGVMVYASRR